MMSGTISNIQIPAERTPAPFQMLSCMAATWSVLAMSLHLWPFEGRHSLEVAAPANLGIMIWVFVATAMAVFSRRVRRMICGCLPDIGVWAFLVVAAVSAAFSPNVGQSLLSLAKLALMYVGAFVLFGVVCERDGWAGRLCVMALAAACVVMIASVASRLLEHQGFGFFVNPYKYGTATAILFVLGVIYLASRRSKWAWLVVPATVLAAVATVSLGGLCGIGVGLAFGIFVVKQRSARLRLTVCLFVMAVVLAVCWQTPLLSHLRDDVRISEPDGHDVRQRYIEWQAQLNLLEARPVSGTGLGCINEYRSMFYGRLPKLNTLAPFDRNGWLLVAAETGIFGLAAFVWLVVSSGRRAWRLTRADSPQAGFGAAVFVALAAACAANTFSAVNYNGVVNAFVLVLALTHHAGRIWPGEQNPEAVSISTSAAPPIADRRDNE